MRESPPPQLVALLERLGLATSRQVSRMAGRVRRLARELPHFESVWIDALAQARVLTPFQAAEIHAGRGESLRVGPYLLCQQLPWPQYVDCYRARRVDSAESVRLLVGAPGVSPVRGSRHGQDARATHKSALDGSLGQLEALAAAADRLRCEQIAPITQVGSQGDRLWAASPWVEGRTAAEWLAHNGRFPPEVVLEIAQAMLVGLVSLEKAGACHGDLSAAGLLLTDTGGVVLLQPGIRAIFRPAEGYAHADLPPETYDYLAPERITDGTPPNTASDVYACGCLWWQLLCGRPPLAGGDSLAKLRSGQAAAISDVRRFAPEVPTSLAAAVSSCLRPQSSGRPESMTRLAATLGPPTGNGRLALARCLARPGYPAERWSRPARQLGEPLRRLRWLTAAAVCLAVAAAAIGGVWRVRLPLPTASIPSQRITAAAGREPQTKQSPIEAALPEDPRRAPGGRPIITSYSDRNVPSPPAPFPQRERGVSVGQPPSPRVEQSPTRPNWQHPQDLVLPCDRPLELESLEVRAGQHVRGAPGKRPLLLVPRAGLNITAENVSFEDIDFVWKHAAQPLHAADPPAVIVRLRCGQAQFRGCSFQSDGHASAPPVAIQWASAADSPDPALSLPSGRLQLADCVLRRVGAGIDGRTAGAVAMQLTNTLHLGSGSLVRLDHCPKPDEPVLIALAQVTLRGAGPLLQCDCQRMEQQPGEISIQADGCAFVPAAGAPLWLICGPDSPARLLENMRWTGQGSLVSPGVVIAAWRRPDAAQQVLDDGGISIAGLVRSEVGFAGNSLWQPAHSRIVRWQVPLQSADPPGVHVHTLPKLSETPDEAP